MYCEFSIVELNLSVFSPPRTEVLRAFMFNRGLGTSSLVAQYFPFTEEELTALAFEGACYPLGGLGV